MTEPSDPSPASDVGRLVGGRYRLAEVIGVGGMATVHRAVDERLDRTVAVKLLRREVIADTDIAMRFRREALAETVLRHPNIVACLETGTDDGQPFLVMELIEGEDLAARLKRVGRLAPAEAERIGLDVARALGVAHIRGIVHRDVKPGNIVLARDGRAMVTDFGIARLAADAEGAVPGTTLGSVHYFSPEQAKGETTTAASDVYGVGLVLYEALTGRRAWSGDTTALLAAARIGAAAPSPRAVRPEVPAALDAIVVRALDPDPARRYPNGNALAAALEPLVGYPDPASPTVAISSATLAAAAMGGAASAPIAALRPRDRPGAHHTSTRRTSSAVAGPLIVLLLVATVVAGALVVASLPGRDEAGAIALAGTPQPTRTPRPTPKPTATPRPTATARPTAAPTPSPTPTPDPTPTPEPPRNDGSNDLCTPSPDAACGLDAGTYEPSAFEPAVRFDVGDGWATTISGDHLIALGRDEGVLTLASAISAVFPDGRQAGAPGSARDLVDAFVATRGVTGGRMDAARIDKRKATILELKPSGSERVALFGIGAQTYFLETFGMTRLLVVDGPGGPMVIAIEPGDGSALGDVMPRAQRVVSSLRFR